MNREQLQQDKKKAFKNLGFSMVPVIFFLIIDSYLGETYLLETVVLTVGVGLVAFFFEWIVRKRLDWINLVSMILIVVTGVLSLYFKSKFFILAKPAITEGFIAFLMVGSHWLRRPLLLQMNKELISDHLPYEMEVLITRLNLSLGISMFPILGITVFAAWKTSQGEFSNFGYGLTKYGLQYGGMILVMFAELYRVKKWGIPPQDPTGFKMARPRENPLGEPEREPLKESNNSLSLLVDSGSAESSSSNKKVDSRVSEQELIDSVLFQKKIAERFGQNLSGGGDVPQVSSQPLSKEKDSSPLSKKSKGSSSKAKSKKGKKKKQKK